MTTMCTAFFLVFALFLGCAKGEVLPEILSAYSTNDWESVSYVRLVATSDAVDLSPIYTNLTTTSSLLQFDVDIDVEVQSVLSGDKFRIQVERAESCIDAWSSMLEQFSMFSAPHPFPLLSHDSCPIGDRAYRGWNSTSISSILFVRNNVFVLIRATDSGCSVLPLAELIDIQLLSFSTNMVSGGVNIPDEPDGPPTTP